MNQDNAPAYGLWSLVILNSLVFIIFAFSFTKPKSNRGLRPAVVLPGIDRHVPAGFCACRLFRLYPGCAVRPAAPRADGAT